MKKLFLIMMLIFSALTGCSSDSKEQINIPPGYENPYYCQFDGDCKYKKDSDGCCWRVIVNRFHQNTKIYTGDDFCNLACPSSNSTEYKCEQNRCTEELMK